MLKKIEVCKANVAQYLKNQLGIEQHWSDPKLMKMFLLRFHKRSALEESWGRCTAIDKLFEDESESRVDIDWISKGEISQ